MILETLDRFSDRVFRWAGRRRIFARMGEACPSVAPRMKEFGNRRGIYRSVLRWQEQGGVFRAKRWIFQGLLSSRVSDLGVFLLCCGGTGLVGNWFFRSASPFSWRILLPLIQILLSPVLLHTLHSTARSIRRSVCLRWFLFQFCGFSHTVFTSKRQTRSQRGVFAALGFLSGLLGIWLTPLVVFGVFVGAILLTLLSALPELAFLCVFLLFPFLNLVPRSTLTLTGLLAVCLVLCLGKTLSGKRQGEWERIDGLVLWLCALFLLGGAVSYGSFYEGALRAFLLFAAWFPVRILFCNSVWRQRILSALVISSFVCAIGGIAEYFLGRAVLSWIDVSRFGDIGGRVCGFFGNPNIFAVYLLLTTPLSLAKVYCQKRTRGKVFFGVAFATQSLCLVLTWSRGAWLGWMLSLFLFLLLCSRRTFSVLLALLVSGVGLVFYLPDNILRRFRSIGSLTDSSTHYRVNTWKGVLRMLREQPFGIGCGESAFRSVFPYYAISGTENVMHAHQIFLEVAVETGFVGLLLFVIVLGGFLRRGIRFCRTEEDGARRAEGVCLLALLAGALTMGLFDSLWYHNGLYWLFWSVAALLVNVMQEGFREQQLFCR